MTILVKPRPAVQIIKPEKGVRINAGGPGLRGLPGATGAPGANGAWAGTEADVIPTVNDRIPIKTAGGLYRLARIRDAEPFAFFNALPDGGRFAGSPEPNSPNLLSYTSPAYFTAYNGSNFAQGPKYIYNNNNNGGSSGVMDSTINELIQAMRPGASGPTYWRYGPEFFTLDITQGSGTLNAVTVASVPHYLSFTNPAPPMPRNYMTHVWARVISGAMALTNSGPTDRYVNGAKLTAPAAYTSASGWQRIGSFWALGDTNDLGYITSTAFQIYATPGSVIRIAAPVIFPGHAYPGQNIAITPSLGAIR